MLTNIEFYYILNVIFTWHILANVPKVGIFQPYARWQLTPEFCMQSLNKTLQSYFLQTTAFDWVFSFIELLNISFENAFDYPQSFTFSHITFSLFCSFKVDWKSSRYLIDIRMNTFFCQELYKLNRQKRKLYELFTNDSSINWIEKTIQNHIT